MLGLLYEKWDEDRKGTLEKLNKLQQLVGTSIEIDDYMLISTLIAYLDEYYNMLDGYGDTNCSAKTLESNQIEANSFLKDYLADYSEYVALFYEF